MADTSHVDTGLRPFVLARDRPGFDTTALRVRNGSNGARLGPPPPVAQARKYLRSRLPAIYQEDDFGVRFVGSFEPLLDPVVALLDCLKEHFLPRLAPRDVLGLMAAWLGVALDEAWPEERWRELVLRAAELGRLRGTSAGLELELRIAFPNVPLRVEDGGGVTFSTTPDLEPEPEAGGGGFVVYCDVPLSEPDAAALARAIERLKPVNAAYRLRIKTPRKKEPEQ